MLVCLQYSAKQPLSHLDSLSKLSVANLQMSAQVPFLICQQYVLRCPLLMGEDSNKMGFCEAKMSFSHTNEAGLTGLEVSSRDSKPKDAMDVPVLYQKSHCSTQALEEISASSSLLIYHSPSSMHWMARQSKRILINNKEHLQDPGFTPSPRGTARPIQMDMSMFQIAVHQNNHHNVSLTLRMDFLPLLLSVCIIGES